jgi:hypothetical protein
MRKEFTINFPFNNDRDHIIGQWQWFRSHLMKVYNMQQLPKTFTETEGKTSENKRVYEDDIEYDMVPAEFNYDWRQQTIMFKDGLQKVTITINDDEYSKYYKFWYEDEHDESRIVLSISDKKAYFNIAAQSPYILIWEKILAEFIIKDGEITE